MASWLEASCRAITSPRIELHNYQLCLVVYTSSLHASTCAIACLPSSSAMSNSCQNIQSLSCLTAQRTKAFIICIPTWRKCSKLLLLGPAICYTVTLINLLETEHFRDKCTQVRKFENARTRWQDGRIKCMRCLVLGALLSVWSRFPHAPIATQFHCATCCWVYSCKNDEALKVLL